MVEIKKGYKFKREKVNYFLRWGEASDVLAKNALYLCRDRGDQMCTAVQVSL